MTTLLVYTYGVKPQRKKQKRQNKIVHQVREAREAKRATYRELKQAKQSEISQDQIQSIAYKFHQLIRSHNRLVRKLRASKRATESRSARYQCHSNFWQFAKNLLDNKSVGDIQPAFTANDATSFFAKTYHAEPKIFTKPVWMPSPTLPTTQFNTGSISMEEITLAIRRARSISAPSPFDDLYNFCWAHAVIPSAWKQAFITLLAKDSASSDPHSPSNFRPIALTSCIGKLFTTVLRNRWIKYMMANGYFNTSTQKAFMPTTPGCTEHHLKLASIIGDARKKHRSLAVCWLDLANAYGSVDHSLITFALQHYNAPPQFMAIIQAFYAGLSARISSRLWMTHAIPLEVGVFQGDPLSVVIFNTVI